MAVEPPPPGVVQQIAGLGPLIGAVGTAVAAVIKAYSDLSSRNKWDFDRQRFSAKAIAAIAFGVGSIVSVSGFLIASAGAVTFGELARRDIERSNLRGKTAATLGTVFGGVGLGLAVYAVWYMVVAPNWSIIWTAVSSGIAALIAIVLNQLVILSSSKRRRLPDVSPFSAWSLELTHAFDSETLGGLAMRIAVGLTLGVVIGIIFTTVFPTALNDINPLPPAGPLPTPSPVVPPYFKQFQIDMKSPLPASPWPTIRGYSGY